MKQGWEIKRLGEVCSITMGQSPSSDTYNDSEGLPFFQGNADFGKIHPSIRVYCNAPIRIADVDDILISVRAPIGAINIADCKCCIGRGLASIRNNAEVANEYIYHALIANKEKLIAQGTGSTFKSIGKEALKELSIPIPPREEQERIVAELDCLSGVIERKREQLRELDALAQSIFYQMFGDPITNEKGFPVYQIDDIITFQGGSQPDKSHFEYEPTDDNIRLIQIRDYKSDKNITYIPKSLARRLCNAEDIMIGRYGPPIFQILKGIEGAYNVALMKAIPKQGNREFIRAFLKQKCLLEYLESMSKRTAGQDGIQMDKLKAYPFPLPPIELQEEFADKIALIEKQQELIKKSIAQTEELFNSRMAYYFS